MDPRSDYDNFYWNTINKEEAHTRFHCYVCGHRRKRIDLSYCPHCPGNVCVECQAFHQTAAQALHRHQPTRPVQLLPPPPPRPKPPPPPPHVPHYRQTRLKFTPV